MSRTRSVSPPLKRVKLESISPKPAISRLVNESSSLDPSADDYTDEESDYEYRCSICLQNIVDRTVIPTCSHEFCFECLMVWSEQSRRCPLCSQSLGGYLIHNIRSKYDFRKHHLPPLRTSPRPASHGTASVEAVRRRRTARVRELERREREEREEKDRLTRSIEQRRLIYEHDLYAKHIASNSHTRFRPCPTPAQFSASPELISRTTTFLRRELQVWDDLDVEFLTTFIISLMKSIDVRSESAIKLLAEFLDMDVPYVEGARHPNAEHFAHEVYSYVRSPFRDLFVYDTVAQYDETSPPFEHPHGQRSLGMSRSRSRSRRRSRDRSASRHTEFISSDRALSWSPSGRQYTSSRDMLAIKAKLPSRQRARSKERGNNCDSSVPPRERVRTSPRRTPSSAGDAMICGTSRTNVDKGKERADVETVLEVPKSLGEADGLDSSTAEGVGLIATENDQIRSRTPQGQSSELQIRKPPRNLSLLESVRSHLSLGTKTHSNVAKVQPENSERPLNAQRHLNIPASIHDTPCTPLTLLARMSDLTTPAQRVERGPELETLTPSQSTANRHQEVTTADNEKISAPTRMFAPETMAQTHGPIPKNNDARTPCPSVTSHPVAPSTSEFLEKEYQPLQTGAHETSSNSSDSMVKHVTEFHQLPISGTADNLHCQRKPANHHMAMRGSGIPIDERPSISAHSNNESHASPSSDIRTKLLKRLQQEKSFSRSDKIRGSAAPEEVYDDRTFLTIGSDSQSSSAIAGRTLDTSRYDPLLIEAKLRKRAQLQVRLTAEKRCNGV